MSIIQRFAFSINYLIVVIAYLTANSTEASNIITVINGEPGKLYKHNIMVGDTVEFRFPEIERGVEATPYRLEVSTVNAESTHPVFVVVRQQRRILSWELPLLIEAANPNSTKDFIEYTRTARTLCVNDMSDHKYPKSAGRNQKQIPQSKDPNRLEPELSQVQGRHTNFTVTLTTFSTKSVTVNLKAVKVVNYFIQTDKEYEAAFSPSEPVYFSYKFPDNDVDTTLLQVTSEDNVCFTLSVQPHLCPIYDLNDEITYQGKYQTIQNNGGLVIHRNDFSHGSKSTFAIVFVAHTDNYICDTGANIHTSDQATYPENTQISRAKFVVKTSKKDGEYGIAIFTLLGFNFAICVAIILLTYAFYRFGTYYNVSKTDHMNDNVDVIHMHAASTSNKLIHNIQSGDSAVTSEVVDAIHNKEEPMLSDFILQRNRNKRIALNYFWHIGNIAIFYGLPVIQLMIFYQRAVNYTGDLDICYYNSLCSHPLYFHDFNHIYSNLGYVMFGCLFIGVTYFRSCKMKNRQNCGIPKLYGLYYAMGAALVFEGVLSACYHICPNQSNFQFDTSFMYVMAMLIMAKLYQNRHPDVQASAYSTFTILGLSVTIAMFGIIFNSLSILLIFFISYIIFCVYVALKLYFFSYVTRGMGKLYEDINDNGCIQVLRPKRQKLFVYVTMGLLINFIMAMTGFFLYPDRVDFGTYLLIILKGNAIIYSIFYMIMKMASGERICFEAMLYGSLAIILWAAGGYFFFNAATHWSKTPAQSRIHNQDCMVLDFYDTHDIWHILSAPALFFSFAFLGAMDDDLIETNHENIHVF